MSGNNDDYLLITYLTQILDRSTAITYFQTAVQLQRETCRLVGLTDAQHVQWSPNLDRLLVWYWAKLFDETLWEAEKIFQQEKPSPESLKITNEVLLDLGRRQYEVKRFDFALTCFKSVYANKRNNGCKHSNYDGAYCLHFMGNCYQETNEFESALQCYQHEMVLREQKEAYNKNRFEIERWHVQMCCTMAKLERWSTALEHLQYATREFQHSLDDSVIAKRFTDIGLCLYALNQYDEAKTHFEKSLVISKNIGEKLMGKNS